MALPGDLAQLLLVYRAAPGVLLPQPVESLGEVLQLVVLLGDGGLEGLVLAVVDVDGHLNLLLGIDLVLLVVVDELLLLAVGLDQLVLQLPHCGVEVALLLLGVVLVLHQNNLYLLLQLSYLLAAPLAQLLQLPFERQVVHFQLVNSPGEHTLLLQELVDLKMGFLLLLVTLSLQLLNTLLQLYVFLAGLVDSLVGFDQFLDEPVVVAFVLVEFILVFAVLLQHQRFYFLVPEFLLVVFLPDMQLLGFLRLLRFDVLQVVDLGVELIDPAVQLLELMVVGVFHFLQLPVEVVPHQFQVLVVLLLDFDQTQLLLVAGFNRQRTIGQRLLLLLQQPQQ